MIIYKATNNTNGKIYIGQTIKSFHQRVKEHKAYAENNPNGLFQKAILKDGWNNFKWEIIDFANSEKELDEKEVYWIEFYQSYYKNGKGYNSTIGGKGVSVGITSSKEEEVTHIKILLETDIYTIKQLCEIFNTTKGTVQGIMINRSYKNINIDNISDEDKIEIIKYYFEEFTLKRVKEKFKNQKVS